MATAQVIHPVVLYARVSRTAEKLSKSVDDQLADLRKWADREGWPVLGEFRDDGISASRYAGGRDRPGWAQVVEFIHSGALRGGALLLWELSRASRDKTVSAALEETCVNAQISLGYKGQLHDPSTSDGSFGVGLDALLAARESHVTSERTRRAVESRAAAGRPHGSMLYGYRKVVDPRTGATIGREIDPETGPIVEEIVRRLLAREPADKIAKDLNDRGILTAQGRAWRGSNLSKLALRPTYAGLRVHHGQVLDDVQATWEPIISLAQHQQIRALFAQPERDKFRNSTHVKHLLSGIARCGREGCDGRMRLLVQTGRANAYGCRDCYRLSRYQEPVDLLVEETVIERLSREDALATLSAGESDDAKGAAAEVQTITAELNGAREAWVAGQITLADFTAYRTHWEPLLADAERRAQPRVLPEALTQMAGPGARQRWEAASITDRRTVLESLYRITILPAGRGSLAFDPDKVLIEPV